MKTCKHTMMSSFTIWEPRYRDKRVLLAAHKVAEHNKVVFTKSASMGLEPYYVAGKDVKKYPKESNGKITVYPVKLEDLQPLELEERCEHDYR